MDRVSRGTANFYAWTQYQAQVLVARCGRQTARHTDFDREHLVEEIEDFGQ